MSTLKDVEELYKSVEISIMIFGCNAEAKQKFAEHLRAVGETLCKERGISLEEGKKLPNSTELGPQAEEKFKQLKQWVSENRR